MLNDINESGTSPLIFSRSHADHRSRKGRGQSGQVTYGGVSAPAINNAKEGRGTLFGVRETVGKWTTHAIYPLSLYKRR